MAYGIIKVDTITFTDGGIDKSVSISGLVQNPTFSGNITVTGTISGNIVRGQTVSGNTVTGTTAQFTSGTFTNITGGVATITSGVFASGSAAAPSVSVGTTDNGIYSPGADQVAISTNGAGRLFVDASGNVGVGTVNPAGRLEIATGAGTACQLLVNEGTTINPLSIEQNATEALIQINASQPLVIAAQNGAGSTSDLRFNTRTQERLRITADGKLGLGTSSPSARFDLHTGSTGDLMRFGVDATTYADFSYASNTFTLAANASKSLAFETGGNEQMRITSDGKLGLGTSAPAALLHVQAPAASSGHDLIKLVNGADAAELVIDTSANAINFKPGAGDSLAFWDATDQALYITSAGNVGVGTTSPSQLLHLAGSSLSATFAGQLIGDTNERLRVGYRTGGPESGLICSQVVSDSTNLYLGSRDTSNGNIVFHTGSGVTEKVRVDSSGRLLVGTSTALADASTVSRSLQIAGINAATAGQFIARFENGPNASAFVLGKSRGATVGTYTVVNSGDQIGRIAFDATDGTKFVNSALIAAEVDGTPGTNDMPGRLVFSTTPDGASSPTERMRIDNAGFISLGGDTNTGFSNPSADNLAITTGGSERARIDSSGRLLVGTSTAISVTNAAGTATSSAFELAGGSTTDNCSASIGCFNSAPGRNGEIIFAKSANDTVGVHTIVSSGEDLGEISFSGSDGTNFIPAASILCEVDGTPGTNDMPGRLVFSTTSDGASSPTERMRITSGGDVLFGTTGIPNGTSIYGAAFESTSNNRQILKTASSVTTANSMVAFYNPNGNVGTISISGSATAYNTSSDYRLKENITPVTDGITRLQQLKPSRFNFIADPDTIVDGFIAHEAQAVVPECVTGEKDEVDDEGNPVYQGIDQSKLVPLLTAALQEAVAKIESLEARLTAAGI